jgi:hypothetical protein
MIKKCLFILLTYSSLFAFDPQIMGRLDTGVLAGGIQTLQGGQETSNSHVRGININGTLVLVEDSKWYTGMTFKPNVVAMGGEASLENASLCLGWFIPGPKGLHVIPYAGGGVSFFKKDGIKLDMGMGPPMSFNQKTYARQGIVGFDIGFQLSKKLILGGTYKYAWTSSKVVIGEDFHVPGRIETKGINSGFLFDYMITDHWTLNAGHFREKAFKKEFDGMKAYAWRLGFSYLLY